MKNQRKEERKSFRKVFLMIPMLLLTIATLSVATYAWWNSLTATQNPVVEIGDRVTIVANPATGFNFGSGLVPIGTDLINGQVDVVTGTIVLNITGIDKSKDNVGLVITNNLTPEFQNVFIIKYYRNLTDAVNEENNINGITNVTNGELSIVITIELDGDQSKYTNILGALVNQNYNIAFTFKLVPQPTPAP